MALSRMVPVVPPAISTRWGSKAALASNLVNRRIAIWMGDRIGYFLISEYPKSGGTWFGKMAAEVVQIPYPEHNIFPVGCPAVVHNHWRRHHRFRRCWYMARDGRDVMVSLYFHRMRNIGERGTAAGDRFRRYYKRLLGDDFEPQDARANLPRFIEDEFQRPKQSFGVSWPEHVRSWIAPEGPRPHVHLVTYESLLEDPVRVLSDAVTAACGIVPDDWVVRMTVEKHSMARQTGRAPGSEDRSNFIRKGIAGDWVNHFTRETATLFDELAGDALVALGYEPDRNWVDRYDLPSAGA